MPLRPAYINKEALKNGIRFIRERDTDKGRLLERKVYWIKPSYIPWAKEVWCGKRDVYLPSDWNEKTRKHKVMDLFRAATLFEEQAIASNFFTWLTSRKIGTIRRSFNLRIRSCWKLFISRHRVE